MSPAEALKQGRRMGGQANALEPRRGRRHMGMWLLSICIVGFVILPLVQVALLYAVGTTRDITTAVTAHIFLNCALNTLVMFAALRTRGRLDRKIADVVTTVLLVHGMLAFFILLARQFYSNHIMLTAGALSILSGLTVMMLVHRSKVVRTALLGRIDPIAEQLRVPCDVITDPTQDLRGYDILFTADLAELSPEWAKVVSNAMLQGQSVRHVAEYLEEDRGQVSVDHFDLEHLPTGGLTSYKTRKRLTDIGLVLMSLPVALPLLALGALAIRINMGGPVLFTQPRVGLGGRIFKIYKLRTMRSTSAPQLKRATIVGDTRITSVGAFLRRFRIDELPQLWNVLKGDMSFIGPRPEQPLLTELYTRELPAFAYRHLVRPGITGWAQVRGDYAADLAETRPKLAYDLFYIKNLSFALDMQILVRTIITLARGSNAR